MDEPDGREVGVILSRGKGRGVAAHVEVLLEANVVPNAQTALVFSVKKTRDEAERRRPEPRSTANHGKAECLGADPGAGYREAGAEVEGFPNPSRHQHLRVGR